MNFARLLQKDEIKKGSFQIQLGVSGSFASGGVDTEFGGANSILTINDSGAETAYKINSPAGEYSILYATGASTPANTKAGLIYYQAGVAVLTGSVFLGNGTTSETLNAFNNEKALVTGTIGVLPDGGVVDPGLTINETLKNVSISGSCDGFRNRVYDIDFNNTTELNSTIYFCRAGHNEFNYSSNPTYVDGTSQIRVKNSSLDQPVSYITTVGLYSADNELLAVAKVSEPLKKTPDTELTLRVRLDY